MSFRFCRRYFSVDMLRACKLEKERTISDGETNRYVARLCRQAGKQLSRYSLCICGRAEHCFLLCRGMSAYVFRCVLSATYFSMDIPRAHAGDVYFRRAYFLHGQRNESFGLPEEIFYESVFQKTIRTSGTCVDSGQHRLLFIVRFAPRPVFMERNQSPMVSVLSIFARDSLPTPLSIFTGSCIPSSICTY